MRSGKSRRKGNVIVLTVVSLVAVIGFAAVALDGGLLQYNRRFAQAVADAAALAAADDLYYNYQANAGLDVSGTKGRAPGPDPQRRSYSSYASFSDPDGNGWLVQEITTRLPGRIDRAATTFGSAADLARALRRAEAAHGEHEKRTGQRDANWPDWYAAYMLAEQSGDPLPS